MTNQIAIALVAVIIAVFAADMAFFGGEMPLFLGKQFVALIEYLSFWR